MCFNQVVVRREGSYCQCTHDIRLFYKGYPSCTTVSMRRSWKHEKVDDDIAFIALFLFVYETVQVEIFIKTDWKKSC